MALLFDKATSIVDRHPMKLDDLRPIVRGLPIGAQDSVRDVNVLGSSLTVHAGRLTKALERLNADASDQSALSDALSHCGAILLTVVAAAEGFQLSLPDVVQRGTEELGS